VLAAQLSQYLPAATLNLATSDQQDQACLDASELLDNFLRGRYALPLTAWGNDIVRYAAKIAIYLLLDGPIGWASQAGSDANIKTGYYEVVGWPDKPGTGFGPAIQRQALHPDVTPTVAQPGDAIHDVPQVFTNVQRGWTSRTGRGVGNI
jgi:hypothetical protein